MAACEYKPEEARFHGRVLVAEDVRTNQILMKSLLGKLGLEVTIAEDGQEAVEKTSSGVFDVILMDIEMPKIDGYQATRVLRKRGISIPVIALTGHTKEEDEAKCLDAGCNDYLSKPIDRLCLIEKLSKYLPSTDSPPNTGASAERPMPSESGAAPCEIDVKPIIDWDVLTSRGFDEALISSVMPICIEDNRKRLLELRSAIKAHDVEQVRLYAHAMKGSFVMVGAAMLAHIACRLEEQAKQHDLSMAGQLLSSMEKRFQEFQTLVSQPDWTKTAKGLTRPAGAAHVH
jgi:two-component system sensor histidine kinase/response regulator